MHLAAKVDVTGRGPEYAAGQRRRHRASVARRLPRAAGVRAAGARLVAVGRPRRALAGRAPAPGRPTPTARAGTTPGARRWPSGWRWRADAPGLAVVAVRPHLVWGPGDTQLVAPDRRAGPGRAAAARRLRRRADRHHLRRQRRRRGRGRASTAASAVARRGAAWSPTASRGRSPSCSRGICAAAGVPGAAPARAVAGRPGGRRRSAEARPGGARPQPDDPPMTRFLAEQLATAHWFDQRRTREALGWAPRGQPRRGAGRPVPVLTGTGRCRTARGDTVCA